MAKDENSNEDGKPLPMKAIAISIAIIFLIIIIVYMIFPAFLNKSPKDSLSNEQLASLEKYKYNQNELNGKIIYQNYCIHCHGTTGKGDGASSVTLKKRPPSFLNSSAQFINGMEKKELLKTINEGILNSEMPSFSYLPENAKKDLIEYIRHIWMHKKLYE